ncbi:MAG: hypothetical protein IJV07_01900 [Alphaproteobacteria bacterium]|nr:hypothetical protein [Alphaproteobacteria bacterium]
MIKRETLLFETGRSMVEILGVLAIIGVLTLGGIWGYRNAIDKSNANTIIDGVNKRALVASHQLSGLEMAEPDMKEFHPDTEVDSISGWEADTFILSDSPDHFAVEVYNVAKGVCNHIIQMHWKEPVSILVNDEIDVDTCPDEEATMTFVFDKVLGSSPYNKCEVDADCQQAFGQDYLCNQGTMTCYRRNDRAGIKDKDGKEYDCDSNIGVKTINKDACLKNCPNRTYAYGYCMPSCREGEFWLRDQQSRADQPPIKCVSCDARTGWDTGSIRAEMCEMCPNRYYFVPAFDGQHRCSLKDCGEGYYTCYNGCCSCHDLDAQNIKTWYNPDGGSYAWNAKAACAACNDEQYGGREVVGGWCRLKTCPPGTFRNGHSCISCTHGSSFRIGWTGSWNTSAQAKNTINDCLSCRDANGNRQRVVEGEYCIRGTKCGNGSDASETGICSDCEDGEFSAGGKCVSCDDDNWYLVTAEECNKCKGKREMHGIDDATHYRTACVRKRGSDEFYSNLGTKSCDIDKIAWVYSNNADCRVCGDKRVIVGEAYCTLPCPSGEFMRNDGVCIPCGASTSYAMGSINGVSIGCSAACPGQRFRNNNNSGMCAKCEAGSYSVGTNATACRICPTDLSDLEKGACIACNGTWTGSRCEGTCGPGNYYTDDNVCTACPADLSIFTGRANEFHCTTCGGTWDTVNFKCIQCPELNAENLSKLDNGACKACGGGWDVSAQECLYCPVNTASLTTPGACYACGKNWTNHGNGTGTCSD